MRTLAPCLALAELTAEEVRPVAGSVFREASKEESSSVWVVRTTFRFNSRARSSATVVFDFDVDVDIVDDDDAVPPSFCCWWWCGGGAKKSKAQGNGMLF